MDLLLLTADPLPTTVLPAVDLLPIKVRAAAPEAASLVTSGPYDLVLLDARHDLAAARTLCRLLGSDGLAVSILAIVTEGGMVAIGPEWGVADVVLASAGPAEVHARLRLLESRTNSSANSGGVAKPPMGDSTSGSAPPSFHRANVSASPERSTDVSARRMAAASSSVRPKSGSS